MSKRFNTTANCIPGKHYMVDLTERLQKIRIMVDQGDYFTINRARQYGKTTTLFALADYLKEDYLVIRLDFQRLGDAAYADEDSFVTAFSKRVLLAMRVPRNQNTETEKAEAKKSKDSKMPKEIQERLQYCAGKRDERLTMDDLFIVLNDWCEISEKPIVLMIDEVDQAADFQVFLSFLAQLRANYIERELVPTFQSVILAGVHDIKNLKRKFVSPDEHSTNSPWNIAADYMIDMSFSPADIAGMLRDYETDYATGMDVVAVAQNIYDYTSGYPFLVSRICKLLDEQVAGTEKFPTRAEAWTDRGLTRAVGLVLTESSTLFDSLTDKVTRYPDLKNILYEILMNGTEVSYNPDLPSISIAKMYGFVRKENEKVVIANRIFETRLYNFFLSSEEERKSEMYRLGEREKYMKLRI